MTRTVKALAASGLFVALLAMTMGANVSTVDAQSPPFPPAAFYGDVTINGVAAPSNTLVEAYIDGVLCADGRTGAAGTAGADSYAIQVPATEPGGEDCGDDGDTVEFMVNGILGGSGIWETCRTGNNVKRAIGSGTYSTRFGSVRIRFGFGSKFEQLSAIPGSG